jgi:molybdenum cofactor guanylyltransferase
MSETPSQFDASQITAAILAGGEGRRVDGRDKGLLLLHGQPLVHYAAVALHGQAVRILICANRNADKYAPFGDVFADDNPGFLGPLAAISTALSHCQTAWLLTVPVDCPDPPHALVERLQAATLKAGSDLAVAFDGERRQPLFALYRRTLAESARAALEANAPVWRWQDACGAVEADFSDRPDAFDNLNTDAELRAWEKRHHG